MTATESRARRSAIVRLMHSTGLRPRRQSGQNFLIDDEVVSDLVQAAAISPGERVLEIGPGLGIVTEALLNHGANVLAVELDRRLVPYLRRKFSSRQNVRIAEGDIMKQRLDREFDDAGYTLVASLPFNITSLVLRNFLERRPRPNRLVLLVQKEVAERVTARPGKMSLLSVAVQYLGAPEIIRHVPRSSFFPQPEVDGAVVRIDVRPRPDDGERQALFRLARVGFSSRRKMLHNNIAAGFRLSHEQTQKILLDSGLHPTARAQELTIKDWQKLAKNLL